MINFESDENELGGGGGGGTEPNQDGTDSGIGARPGENLANEPSPEGNYANLGPGQVGFQAEFGGNSVAPPPNGYDQFGLDDEIVQVVYQSEPNGYLVGVESSLIGGPLVAEGGQQQHQHQQHQQQQQQQQPLDTPQYATVEPRNNRLAPAGEGADETRPEEQLIDISDTVAETKSNPKDADDTRFAQKENIEEIQEEIGHILSRHSKGAAESGSFRQNNFRKKLGLSVSTNENDLTAHRQKFLESREASSNLAPLGSDAQLEPALTCGDQDGGQAGGGQPADHNNLSKFKRTHSVSFNMSFSRSNRHSVDIRNLPSYLTHKRASIVDVARGAMSSLISSLGGGGSGPGSSIGGASQRRGSSPPIEEEPIFEEPIAPTLSLGQRVALVRQSGAEFGTVGWIGQLADFDDDWIVGVIFDNMIGNCDGAYNGTRYFYARDNYAMFVPLSLLTKTDNYIGRPETGTMLSRMSISLKPGQLISIQRSSIRLQHCFLNAPHQRVGHDVRAVSNRLHCQCHNCGPCAHLTKQSRAAHSIPHFGAKHLTHHKKNSLAHAAVELLAHHHHHFHDEEEEHEEKDYQFGDNAAHACNYVRYSCCQQNGVDGHEFMNDCGMVRPELLDNLIHAPKAPHRRSRPRRSRAPAAPCGPWPHQAAGHLAKAIEAGQQPPAEHDSSKPAPLALGGPSANDQSTAQQHPAAWNLDPANATYNNTIQSSSWLGSEHTAGRDADASADSSSFSSCSSDHSSSSSRSSRSDGPQAQAQGYTSAEYQYDSSTYRPASGAAYNTMDSQYSIMDQRRFIYQRDSSAIVRYQPSYLSDDQVSQTTTGCFNCFKRKERRKTGKRKLSAKDRMLEYRRRQSTFVPSTLAKPQDDFASHGIILPSTSAPRDNNSDYSSYSRSSSSPDSQPDVGAVKVDQNAFEAPGDQFQQQKAQQTFGDLEHGPADFNGRLKSSLYDTSLPVANIDYTDYSFDDRENSLKIRDSSRDSALTDLGYSDTYKTNSSSDTLKQLVDQTINEQISLPGIQEDLIISPILSLVEEVNPSSEQFEISSPTASMNDYNDDIRQGIEDLSISSAQNEPENTNFSTQHDGTL